MLTIAVADDQALIRHGLRALLELAGIGVAVEAEDGEALLAALRRTSVDVVLSDIRMPRRSGVEAVRAMRERGDTTPVLLLTTFDDPGLLRAGIEAGAQGFMLKDAAPEELKDAIERLARGETLLSPISLYGMADSAEKAPAGARLSPREISVLRLVAGGFSNKEVGRALRISDGTVKNHLTDILTKLQARDRTHAVLKALAARLL